MTKIVFFTVLSIIFCGGVSCGQEAIAVQAMADGYEQNLTKFSKQGLILFDYADSTSASSEKARKGPVGNAAIADCYYAYQSLTASYKQLFSIKDMQSSSKEIAPNKYQSKINSLYAMTDGKQTLLDMVGTEMSVEKYTHGMKLRIGSNEFYSQLIFPLMFSALPSQRVDFAAMSRLAIRNEQGISLLAVEENVLVDDISSILIKLTMKNGIRSYWIDPKRGCLPVRIEDITIKGDVSTWFFDDIVLVDNLGWLPHALTFYSERSKRVKKLIIKEYRFEKPIPAKYFQIDLDNPLFISDVANSRMYGVDKKIDINKLSKLDSSRSIPVLSGTNGGASPSEPEGEVTAIPYATIITTLAVITALLFILFITIKFKKK